MLNTAEKLFLLAAKELNFSRAAKMAYVTPQDLSSHINRLEKEHHVKLFERRPKLKLTQDGKVLQSYLLKVKTLEYHLKNELADLNSGAYGTIRLGIPVTRGKILISRIVSEFQKNYPNVNLEIRLADNPVLEELLLSNQIDLFLGLDTLDHPLYKRKLVATESLCLVVPKKIMHQQFGKNFSDIHKEFLKKGADFSKLTDIPFAIGNSTSANNRIFRDFLITNDLHPRVPVTMNEFDIRLDFCLKNNYAVICSRFNLYYLLQQKAAKNTVYCYPIHGCDKLLKFEIVTLKNNPSLEYQNCFINIIANVVHEYDEEVTKWIKCMKWKK